MPVSGSQKALISTATVSRGSRRRRATVCAQRRSHARVDRDRRSLSGSSRAR